MIRVLSLLLLAVTLCGALEVLTVHMVPHSHDDLGYKKTVDQYYTGTRRDIQVGRVKYIIENTINALLRDPERKFVYAEIAFFERWWRNQNEKRKAEVRVLVSEGRLEFVNGGWSMNDEGATYYQGIVDQMTLGHQFLLREFGVRPTVGWHLDTFGHSSTMASLFADMGFDGVVFARSDYEDHANRVEKKELELVWRSSPSRGKSNEIFTALTYRHYTPPTGFNFDGVHGGDGPIQADKSLYDYDLPDWVERFSQHCRLQAEAFGDSNIMLTMGTDFHYENAEEWYDNMGILIDAFNSSEFAHYKMNVIYSTPSIYIKAKHDLQKKWTVKYDDFFPYADEATAFWTGYFTSRAPFKGYVRQLSGFLQQCRLYENVAASMNIEMEDKNPSELLARALGISMHHDAIPGTARQPVNDDYIRRLYIGATTCDNYIGAVLRKLSGKDIHFDRCANSNVTVCDTTEAFQSTDGSETLNVVVSNSLYVTKRDFIRVPVSHTGFKVLRKDNSQVMSQVSRINDDTLRARHGENFTSSVAKYELVFPAIVEGLGIETFRIQSPGIHKIPSVEVVESAVLENPFVRLEFTKGAISKMVNKNSGVSTPLVQTWEYYLSRQPNADEDSKQMISSGAYVFRPVSSDTTIFAGCTEFEIQRGDVYDEVYQVFGEYVSQRVRLYHDSSFVEIEFTVGVVDVSDGQGREVITKFKTDLNTDETMFTDANGREMIERKLNYRATWDLTLVEPAAGNYYPINSRVAIRDTAKDVQFSVVTDRSQGGASLRDGELEIMVNRRMLYGDWNTSRGVAEALDEDVVARGKHWLILDTIAGATESVRVFGEHAQRPLSAFFGISKDLDVSFTLGKTSLPENIHLSTMQRLNFSTVLVRLAHLFAEGEGESSEVVDIDLKKHFDYTRAVEVTLTGLHSIENVNRMKWQTEDDDVYFKTTSVLVDNRMTSIAPMEIRTFLLHSN